MATGALQEFLILGAMRAEIINSIRESFIIKAERHGALNPNCNKCQPFYHYIQTRWDGDRCHLEMPDLPRHVSPAPGHPPHCNCRMCWIELCDRCKDALEPDGYGGFKMCGDCHGGDDGEAWSGGFAENH